MQCIFLDMTGTCDTYKIWNWMNGLADKKDEIIRKLEEENESLRRHFHYRPDGQGAKEALEHFRGFLCPAKSP